MKPRLGITTSPDVHDDPLLVAIERAYVDAVARTGGVPLLLPVLDPVDVEDLLGGLDGVLLSGGGDVDPAAYGGEAVPEVGGVHPGRDAFELALLRAAVAADVPVLGVCRGVQLLNVGFGGTLVAHLPAVGALAHRDRDRSGEAVHPVRLDPASRLAEVVGRAEVGANSLHHQAVDRLGEGLRAVGWAPDGTVEGVEPVGDVRLLGVQWHPELLAGHDELFAWLAREAAAPRRRRR
ncbi:MAG: gamma-glutamyl-gamma-aminobutyrate hydrolase family protein [Acidimicrobiia bacterium]